MTPDQLASLGIGGAVTPEGVLAMLRGQPLPAASLGPLAQEALRGPVPRGVTGQLGPLAQQALRGPVAPGPTTAPLGPLAQMAVRGPVFPRSPLLPQQVLATLRGQQMPGVMSPSIVESYDAVRQAALQRAAAARAGIPAAPAAITPPLVGQLPVAARSMMSVHPAVARMALLGTAGAAALGIMDQAPAMEERTPDGGIPAPFGGATAAPAPAAAVMPTPIGPQIVQLAPQAPASAAKPKAAKANPKPVGRAPAPMVQEGMNQHIDEATRMRAYAALGIIPDLDPLAQQ